jgi:hypothetical protein
MNPGRKKRVKKGIESLERQIAKHVKKLEDAQKSGRVELAEYYRKEIRKFKANIEKKRRSIRK